MVWHTRPPLTTSGCAFFHVVFTSKIFQKTNEYFRNCNTSAQKFFLTSNEPTCCRVKFFSKETPSQKGAIRREFQDPFYCNFGQTQDQRLPQVTSTVATVSVWMSSPLSNLPVVLCTQTKTTFREDAPCYDSDLVFGKFDLTVQVKFFFSRSENGLRLFYSRVEAQMGFSRKE